MKAWRINCIEINYNCSAWMYGFYVNVVILLLCYYVILLCNCADQSSGHSLFLEPKQVLAEGVEFPYSWMLR